MKSISSWLIVALLIFPACEDEHNNGSCPSNVDFGDPYVFSSGWCGTPPFVPAVTLQENILNMGVSYTGGCEEHDFFLKNCSTNSTVYLWLMHDSNGDTCEAIIWDYFQFTLADEIMDMDRIVVLDPNCEDSVIVKDNQD